MLDNVTDQPLTAEENEELVIRLKSGEMHASKLLITGNIPFVKHKVGIWLVEYPNLAFLEDDMLSVGILALVRVVNRLEKVPTPPDSNISGYISVAIHRAIGRYIGSEYKHKVMGQNSMSVRNSQVEDDPTKFIDFVDALLGACPTEEHRIVLQMRAEGHTEGQIAQVLDCSQQTVNVLKTEILANFQQGEAA